MTHGDDAVRCSAVAAFADLSVAAGAAMPALLRALDEDGDWRVRAGAAFALGQMALGASLGEGPSRDAVVALAKALRQDKAEAVRLWAARALLKFGPDGLAAVRALADTLRYRDGYTAAAAADALSRLGPEAVPALAKALGDPRCEVRGEIARRLGGFGLAARPAVPALLDALKDEHPYVVVEAAHALMRVEGSTAAPFVVPALVAVLNGRECTSTVHSDVLRLLGEIGPEARPAAPILCDELTATNDSTRRRAAAQALGKIRPGKACRAPLLQLALEDEIAEVRAAAVVALWQVGRRSDALAVLTDMLGHEEVRVRIWAARAAGEIGPGARGVLPALRRILRRKGDRARSEAALAFWRVSSRVEASGFVFDPRREALSVLLESTQDETSADRDRLNAIDTLALIGREEPAAVPALVRLVRDPVPYVRNAAAAALGQIGPTAAEASADLEAMLKDEDSENRWIAAVALCQIGGSRSCSPAVARLLEKRPWLVLQTDGLAKTPEVAACAVPCLLQMLRHDDQSIYEGAAAALRHLDPKAADRAGVP
jgi:HEAT repeat protein